MSGSSRTAVKAAADIPLDQLRQHPGNPRKITKVRLEQLQRTLTAERDMLAARPLIALPDGTVIAGNQRLAAARELGWETIPVVYADLDPDTAERWMLLDNRPAGEDDTELLAAMLREMGARGADIDLAGYLPQDADAILRAAQPVSPRDPDDAPPAPAVPKSVRGQVYELGAHRVMCGDSTDYAQAIELVGSESVDAIWTDPPYGIAYEAMRRDEKIANDEDLPTARVALEDALDAITSHVHFVCCSWRSVADATAALEKVGAEAKACIVWDKGHAVQNLDRFGKRHEFVLYAGPFGGERTVDSDVWEIARDYKPDHPTPKPVELIERALAASTGLGAAVYDPFAGSGSTLIAAEMTGRRCFAMELDPGYCDVIRQRYADYTNQPQYAP